MFEYQTTKNPTAHFICTIWDCHNTYVNNKYNNNSNKANNNNILDSSQPEIKVVVGPHTFKHNKIKQNVNSIF